MSALPTDFLYSEEHEWVNTSAVVEGETVRVGITHIAAEALGEIVFVELPEVGTEVEAGEAFGEVESTKSVSDIYAPVSGEVVAVNEALDDNAGLINEGHTVRGGCTRSRFPNPGPHGCRSLRSC